MGTTGAGGIRTTTGAGGTVRTTLGTQSAALRGTQSAEVGTLMGQLANANRASLTKAPTTLSKSEDSNNSNSTKGYHASLLKELVHAVHNIHGNILHLEAKVHSSPSDIFKNARADTVDLGPTQGLMRVMSKKTRRVSIQTNRTLSLAKSKLHLTK